jgi:hypothetical protein
VRLGCIVTAHRDPEQLAVLLRVLRHPDVSLYLHLDRRQQLGPFRRAMMEERVDDVVLLRRHRVSWGAISCVDAELEGLAAGAADGCDYFVLISGQDFPLRPMPEIVDFLADNVTTSFLEHWPVAQSVHRFGGRDRTDFYAYSIVGRRMICIPRGEDTGFLGSKGRLVNQALRVRGVLKPPRRFPPYLSPFAGSMWWNISRAGADHVLDFVAQHPDYRRYHVHTMAPDEMFVQSILAGTKFADGHRLVADNLRFYSWEGTHASTLTSQELPAMLESGKLFARKFDPRVDASVLGELAELVERGHPRNPHEAASA